MKLLNFLIVLICLLHACKIKNAIISEEQSTTIHKTGIHENQILTLVLEFKIDTINSNDHITLSHKIISSGTIKKETHDFNASHKYQLAFLNSGAKEFKRLSFDDPLRKRMEHSTEQGELSMSDITLDRDAVAIRMTFSEEISKLKIYRVDGSELIFVKSFEL